jgi:hypothetical protein
MEKTCVVSIGVEAFEGERDFFERLGTVQISKFQNISRSFLW